MKPAFLNRVRLKRAIHKKASALLYQVQAVAKKGKRHARAAIYGHLRPGNWWPGENIRPVSRDKRIEIFFTRLKSSPAASNPDEALALISRMLNEVEDECSGIPANPCPGLEPDGRMYPPQPDMIKPDGIGGVLALTRGHRIEITANGAMTFRIRREPDKIVFEKRGRADEAKSKISNF